MNLRSTFMLQMVKLMFEAKNLGRNSLHSNMIQYLPDGDYINQFATNLTFA